jgi:LDH2 family malate/lactate/ureidoglycolate dehydrogenase
MAPSSVPLVTFAAESLRSFVEGVFVALDVPPGDAATAADVLVSSDLRGIDSHGVARLPTYVGCLRQRMINPTPTVRVVRETPSTATVDGDNGLGLVVGPAANRIAIAKAAEIGTGWVSVRNTNHFGIAGYYVLRAVEAGLIGWSMTNSSAIVAPLWGAEARLGTNPIAVGLPAGEEPPIVVDMATSAVAYGKVEIAARKQEPIPEGWAIGADGHPTSDPNAVLGGALLPLGSTRELGGHKGYGLAIVVDLLCCALSGANWGPWAPPFSPGLPTPARQVGLGIGHFFGAMRVDAFLDAEEFGRQVDDFIRTMRATRPQPGTGGPLLPGDPEREAELDRAERGVPLLGPVVDALRAISEDLHVPLDDPLAVDG